VLHFIHPKSTSTFLVHHHFVTPKALNPPNATAMFSYPTASQFNRNYIGPLLTVNFPLTAQRRGPKNIVTWHIICIIAVTSTVSMLHSPLMVS